MADPLHAILRTVLQTTARVLGVLLRLAFFLLQRLLEWNLTWNPIVILGRRVLLRLLLNMDATTRQLAEMTLDPKRPKPTPRRPPVPDPEIDRTPDDEDTEPEAPSASASTASTPLRWLRPDEHAGDHVAIVSYPRCGNSLMRGLLERITGVFSGCDTNPKRALSQQLRDCGMSGEGVVDDSVWFVKTHFPERTGWKEFRVHKAIVIVRNPWDAIDSYFNMTLTNTHNKSLHESQYARFAARWDGMLRHEIDVWMKFYRYWTSQVEIPVIVVRYEDLLMHRAESLRRVFLFLIDRPTLDGTEWQARIDEAMATSGENTGPYVPRVGKIGASFKHYSDEQFQYIRNTAELPLRGFGYDPATQDFPNKLPLPSRQVKKGKTLDASLVIPIDPAKEIRRRDDPYGRHATRYRKALTEPVIASDGTELNMQEVVLARAQLQVKEQTVSPRASTD